MKALRSIRGRVAALATVAVAVVLAAVGVVVVTTFAQRERDHLDERLAEPTPRGLGRALASDRLPGQAAGPPGFERNGDGPAGGGPRAGPGGLPRGLGGRALRPEGEFLRLLRGGEVIASVDAPDGLPRPVAPGFRTVDAGGETYRTLARTSPDGTVLEVGAELAGVRERVGALGTGVLVVSALGVAVVAALAWWLAGLAVRPLAGLRDAVARVSTTRDLSNRLPAQSRLEEVDALSDGVNAMLGRLERSASETERALEATRRFAADAGHELRTPMTALRANLGALLRNPRLDGDERQAVLGEAESEAERTVRLLEALQTLARGDAGAALPREEIELADLVDAALERAARRHPAHAFDLRVAEDATTIEGWADGLQVLVDNLIENAARHGRPAGRVEVVLEPSARGLRLAVDDDGPGVRAEERERVFERFARADGAGDGSGLGLALVRQQARLHGGETWVEDSELGGARFVVELEQRGSSSARVAPTSEVSE